MRTRVFASSLLAALAALAVWQSGAMSGHARGPEPSRVAERLAVPHDGSPELSGRGNTMKNVLTPSRRISSSFMSGC